MYALEKDQYFKKNFYLEKLIVFQLLTLISKFINEN